MHVILLWPGVLVHVIVLIFPGDTWLPYRCLLISSILYTVACKSLAQEHRTRSSCDHVPVIAKKKILLATIYRINTPHTLITKDWEDLLSNSVCWGEGSCTPVGILWWVAMLHASLRAPTSIPHLHSSQNSFFKLTLTMTPCTPTKKRIIWHDMKQGIHPISIASNLGLDPSTVRRNYKKMEEGPKRESDEPNFYYQAPRSGRPRKLGDHHQRKVKNNVGP